MRKRSVAPDAGRAKPDRSCERQNASHLDCPQQVYLRQFPQSGQKRRAVTEQGLSIRRRHSKEVVANCECLLRVGRHLLSSSASATMGGKTTVHFLARMPRGPGSQGQQQINQAPRVTPVCQARHLDPLLASGWSCSLGMSARLTITPSGRLSLTAWQSRGSRGQGFSTGEARCRSKQSGSG